MTTVEACFPSSGHSESGIFVQRPNNPSEQTEVHPLSAETATRELISIGYETNLESIWLEDFAADKKKTADEVARAAYDPDDYDEYEHRLSLVRDSMSEQIRDDASYWFGQFVTKSDEDDEYAEPIEVSPVGQPQGFINIEQQTSNSRLASLGIEAVIGERRLAVIAGLYIRPGYQGMGLASALAFSAIYNLNSRLRCIAKVPTDNQEMRTWLEGYSFKPKKEYLDKINFYQTSVPYIAYEAKSVGLFRTKLIEHNPWLGSYRPLAILEPSHPKLAEDTNSRGLSAIADVLDPQL